MKMDRDNNGSMGSPSQIQSHIPLEGFSSIQCHLRGTQAQQRPSHFPGTTFESEW